FGVTSYVVAQRQREIGIRMALGARRAQVARMVVAGGLGLAGIGLALGFVGTLVMGRALRSQLYGVALLDPVTLVGVLGLLALSAIVATLLPARRAARLDPSRSLREG